MGRLICCLLAAMLAEGASPLFQASVEGNSNWSALRGSAAVDAAVTRENRKSLRVEPKGTMDAAVQFAPVPLKIGDMYEVSGWVRSEDLQVSDRDGAPIATGAALTMASMPFDVHSASLGGTQPWTRLSLKFVASRSTDQILLTVGNGGSFRGKAWFEGVTLEKISSNGVWPSRDAVRTFGPAYRYPAAGWIYLHVEGKPYERGYQHGYLMAREIPEYLARCAATLDHKADEQSWNELRTTTDALFLRGYDKEILEEMKGIADGASDAGAKWLGRRIDLVDIVVANATVELSTLQSAVSRTRNGLEDLHLDAPSYFDHQRDVSILERCSAFAATGKATRDGKMVIGHVTWWGLTLAEQTNVMLDIKPAEGHRVLMQSYPGGIESGTDWYQNDAGMVLTETTIRQSPFNVRGTPVSFRARKAIQYAGNVDEMVAYLGTDNNGLYTNEWLIGDAKNNEIAMFELGTNATKLWRSSKDEWFGGTEGFYWGCNNAKDLGVRLEYVPDPQGKPEYLPFVPTTRDLAWQDLYRKHHGQIDEQFGFAAFASAPLTSGATMDAKIATADMASNLMVWAAIGKPNQREWVPSDWQKRNYDKNDGLYPSGYYVFSGNPSDALRATIQTNESARVQSKRPESQKPDEKHADKYKDRLWKGWVLPASDADTWFAAGSAAYYRDLQSDDPDRAAGARAATYRRLRAGTGNTGDTCRLEEAKGALYLDSLRRRIGDDKFFELMNRYFAANTTKAVTAASFVNAAGIPFSLNEPGSGASYLITDLWRPLASTVIVYGTLRDAGANRFAAGQLQGTLTEWLDSSVSVRKDFEVSEEELRGHDVVFVGRPESNSALAAWRQTVGLDYDGAEFRLNGKQHASEREGIVFASGNPVDPAHMVLVVAGNDALRTVKLARGIQDWRPAEYMLFDDGETPVFGFVKPTLP